MSKTTFADLWWITALGGIIWEPSTLLTRGSWNNGARNYFYIFLHHFPKLIIFYMETLCWLTGWKTLITPPFGLRDQIRSFCTRKWIINISKEPQWVFVGGNVLKFSPYLFFAEIEEDLIIFRTHQWRRKAALMLCKVIRIENLSFKLQFFPLLLFVAPLGIRSAFQLEIMVRNTGQYRNTGQCGKNNCSLDESNSEEILYQENWFYRIWDSSYTYEYDISLSQSFQK